MPRREQGADCDDDDSPRGIERANNRDDGVTNASAKGSNRRMRGVDISVSIIAKVG